MMDFVVITTFKNGDIERKRFYAYTQAEDYFDGVEMTKDFETLTLMNGFGIKFKEVTNL